MCYRWDDSRKHGLAYENLLVQTDGFDTCSATDAILHQTVVINVVGGCHRRSSSFLVLRQSYESLLLLTGEL